MLLDLDRDTSSHAAAPTSPTPASPASPSPDSRVWLFKALVLLETTLDSGGAKRSETAEAQQAGAETRRGSMESVIECHAE